MQSCVDMGFEERNGNKPHTMSWLKLLEHSFSPEGQGSPVAVTILNEKIRAEILTRKKGTVRVQHCATHCGITAWFIKSYPCGVMVIETIGIHPYRQICTEVHQLQSTQCRESLKAISAHFFKLQEDSEETIKWNVYTVEPNNYKHYCHPTLPAQKYHSSASLSKEKQKWRLSYPPKIHQHLAQQEQWKAD